MSDAWYDLRSAETRPRHRTRKSVPFPGTVDARRTGCTCRVEPSSTNHVAIIDTNCTQHGGAA